METYAKYKVLMLKKEGNTSNVCQRYDQDAARQDKAISRDDNYFLRSWIPASIGVLNSWFLVNVGLQNFRKLHRESWMSSFKKFNLHPKHRVSINQWCDRIKTFLQGGDYFKQDTTLTINNEYYILSSSWKVTELDEKKDVV